MQILEHLKLALLFLKMQIDKLWNVKKDFLTFYLKYYLIGPHENMWFCTDFFLTVKKINHIYYCLLIQFKTKC